MMEYKLNELNEIEKHMCKFSTRTQEVYELIKNGHYLDFKNAFDQISGAYFWKHILFQEGNIIECANKFLEENNCTSRIFILSYLKLQLPQLAAATLYKEEEPTFGSQLYYTFVNKKWFKKFRTLDKSAHFFLSDSIKS